MDLSGGVLNYQGISVLNWVETSSCNGKYVSHHVICIPACLACTSNKMHMKDQEVCPFKCIDMNFGEGIEFDYSKTTKLVLDAYEMTDVGKI